MKDLSIQTAKAYLKAFQADTRVLELANSSATVELAAVALGCAPARIAKTLALLLPEGALVLVTAGDTKLDNAKYRRSFGTKAKMLAFEETEAFIGHAPGGVCPFGVKPGIRVYLDVSLRRFQTVFPAAGSGNSAIELSIPELEAFSGAYGWVDVCKNWESDALC